VVGAEVPKVLFAGVELGVQVVDEGQGRDQVPGPWLGQRESGQELAATAPNGSLIGQGVPKASRVAWRRCWSAVRWRTR
jgi:hypothetical protein